MAATPKGLAIIEVTSDTDEPVHVIRAKDRTSLYLMWEARNRAVELGADPEFIADLDVLIARWSKWQNENGTKIPDLASDEYELDTEKERGS